MAWNGIQMPGPGSVSDSMQSLGDRLMQMAQLKAQQDQHAQRMLMDKEYRDAQIAQANRQLAIQEEAQKRLQAEMQVNAFAKLRQVTDPNMRAAMIQAAGGQIHGMADSYGQAPSQNFGGAGGTTYSAQDLEDIGQMGEAYQATQPRSPSQPITMGQQPGPGAPSTSQMPPGGGGPMGLDAARRLIASGRHMDPVGGGPGGLDAARRLIGSQQPQVDPLEALMTSAGSGQPPTTEVRHPLLAAAEKAREAQNNNPLMAAVNRGTTRGPLLGKSIDFTMGGQRMTLDPAREQEVQAGERERLAGQTEGAFAGDQKYARLGAGLARMGVDEDTIAKTITSMMERDQAMDLADRRMTQSEALRREGWDEAMKRALASRNTYTTPQKLDDARADEASARAAVKDIFNQFKFGEVQAQNRKFNDMAAQIAQPNAALDAATAGTWVKQAQGGTGVISDSDMEAFWNRIGGVTTRTSQWVENVLTGRIEPEKRAVVADAVKWLASRAGENLRTVKDAVDTQFSESPTLGPFREQMLRTYFPEERARPRAAAPSGRGGARGKGTPARDRAYYMGQLNGGEK